MTGTEVVPVVIVGAGPVGVCAATLLAQGGIASLVLERFTQAYPLPRAVHLDDEVFRILQQIGVAEGFRAISRPALGLRLVDARLRVLAQFSRAETVGVHGYPQANMFDQPDLESLLRQNLAAHPQAELRGGAEVLSIDQPSGGPAPVRVSYQDEQGQIHQVWARAVLGCDGANSITRQQIGTALLDLHFTERWLVVDVRCPVQLNTWDGVYQVCDSARAATYMQIGADRYRWEFRMRDGESVADLTDEARLAELIAPWTAGVAASALTVLRSAEYTFRARLADRWRQGRVFLLGDAAHVTPPFVGQGLAAGLRDARNLAWKLALVLREAADDRLLDTYESERKPHAKALIQLAVRTGWAMTGGQDGAAAARRAALSVICRTPGAAELILRGTSVRLRPGLLVRRRRRTGPVFDLAGTLCPQPWIEEDAGRRNLDDVLGPSFAVLANGPLDPELLALARGIGARVVQLAPGADGNVHVPGAAAEALRSWLARAQAGAVLLRPDRVVMAQARRSVRGGPVGRSIARHSLPWRPLLPPVHHGFQDADAVTPAEAAGAVTPAIDGGI